MATKLTLLLEIETIERTKKFAADEGKSLSELVENYFKYLNGKSKSKEKAPSYKIQKLKGSVKVPPSFDY